jgi:beta-glucosidase
VDYNKAGDRVGYKWFESMHLDPLFPFGFGLSYTTYAYSDLSVDHDGHAAKLTVRNTGHLAGSEIAEVYAVLPKAAGENYKRLVGFARIPLKPGQSKTVRIPLNALALSIYDTKKGAMARTPGSYKLYAGPSSAKTPLKTTFTIKR